MKAVVVIAALAGLVAFPTSAFGQIFDDGTKGIDHPERFDYHVIKDKGAKAYREKEYEKALQFFVLAVQHMEKQPSREFFVYEDLGDTYRQVGRHRSACWAFLRAVAVIDRFQKQGTAEARMRLVKKADECVIPELPAEFSVLGWKDEYDPLYVKLMGTKYDDASGKGDQPTALKYHLRLLRHRELYHQDLGKSYEILGDLYLRVEKPSDAAWAYQRAIGELPKQKSPDEQENEKRLIDKMIRCGVPAPKDPPKDVVETEGPAPVETIKPSKPPVTAKPPSPAPRPPEPVKETPPPPEKKEETPSPPPEKAPPEPPAPDKGEHLPGDKPAQ